MSANLDLERRIADFYATEAPPRAPDWVLESALATIDTTPQRRARIRVPWRFQDMNSFAKLAVAAVAVIAVGAVGLAVLRPGTAPGVGGGPDASPTTSPSTTPAPSQSPSSSASAPPALGEMFTSPMYGYSVRYPVGWKVTPGTDQWRTGLPRNGETADYIYQRDSDSPFVAFSSQPLAGKPGDEWAADLSTHADWADSCAPRTEPVIIDGITGLLAIHCPDDGVQSAFVWLDDRGYSIVGYRLHGIEYFKSILAAVNLLPGDALDAAPSASS